MSHRMALALSVVLTFVLAAGVFAGRDWLFAAEPASNAAAVTPTSAVSDDPGGTNPRIIEIPLPETPERQTLRADDDRDDERDDDRDDDDRHEREEHDDDDDEDHGEDDDD